MRASLDRDHDCGHLSFLFYATTEVSLVSYVRHGERPNSRARRRAPSEAKEPEDASRAVSCSPCLIIQR
jgi:hypothetical protein